MSALEPKALEARQRDAWLGIEFRYLEALEALAHERSFHGAAERLGYVQSAVSQQLVALERLIGARLVERERGHKLVALTKAGQRLVEHADAIFVRLQLAKADLDALADGRSGTLRVGLNGDLAAGIVPVLSRTWSARWPDVSLDFEERASESELVDALGAGRLDGLLTSTAPSPSRFVVDELIDDRFVLLVDPASPIAGSASLTSLDGLAGLPLVLAGPYPELVAFEHRLACFDVRPGCVIRTGSVRTAQGLAADGLGGAIVPRFALAAGEPAVVELGDLVDRRVISWVAHADGERAAALERLRVVVRSAFGDVLQRFDANGAGPSDHGRGARRTLLRAPRRPS